MFLSSCVTSTVYKHSREESIQAVFIQGDKLYAAGPEFEYEFNGNSVIRLQSFLNSTYKNKILFTTANFWDYTKNTNEIRGNYSIYLDKEIFTKEEVDDLVKNYKFGIVNVLGTEGTKAMNKLLPDRNINKPLLSGNYYLEGRVVKLDNRDELLEKYLLKKPLEVTVESYGKEVSVNGKAILGPMLVAPAFIMWGVACKTQGC
ncbi:hypothetical protein AB8Q18_08525 [Neisseriaceae bacterium CLB008]